LDADALSTYERTGVLVLPGLLGPDRVAALDAEIGRLADDESVRQRQQAILEPGGNALRSLFEVHADDGPFSALARDPLLADIARDLLDSDVYIHQSRINLKPGFRGKEFYWHSDFETWHTEDGMPSMRAVSCSVLLTENESWNGPLLTIPGSHKWFVSSVGETPDNHHEQSLRRQEVGVPDDDSLTELVRRGGLQECVGPAGTVVFFECNVMHGSNGNITPSPRRNVFLVYNSVENALEEPFAAPAPRPTYIASRDATPI
jgi:ectoine hydroxylase